MTYHIAQLNMARMRALLDDPIMAEFMQALGPINAIADNRPGFVWRLQDDAGPQSQCVHVPKVFPAPKMINDAVYVANVDAKLRKLHEEQEICY